VQSGDATTAILNVAALKSEAVVTWRLITEPNKFVAGVHDRMPVILEEKQFDAWLDDSAVPTSLVKMLKPVGERVLACQPVSKRVNSSRADGDDATLIDKIGL
jgi:putative SOS response-associated peptidase YedK